MGAPRILQKSTIQKFIDKNADSPVVKDILGERSLNKTSLSELANVGYSVIHRSYIFLYDALPPKLAKLMKSIDAEPKTDWEAEYIKDKLEVMHYFQEFYTDPNNPVGNWLRRDPNDYCVSWKDWRETVSGSQMAFARMLLINPGILQHYEDNLTQDLPVVIKERLLFFGMEPRFVNALDQMMVG